MHVLLANQSKAVLFKNGKGHKIFEIDHKFENPKYSQKESELFSHRAGTSFTSHTNDQATLGESQYKDELVHRFCNQVTDYLSHSLEDGKLKSLVVVCGPSLLGNLRKQLYPKLKKISLSEVQKNFYTEKTSELKKFLRTHKIKKAS